MRSILPPEIRVKNPSSSVSDPLAAANAFDRPWCSNSVTTQLPTTTLNPNENAWIAAKRYSRVSRKKPASNCSPACRAVRGAGRREARARPVRFAATMTALRYGARNPVQPANPGTSASAIPGASTDAEPYTPCVDAEPPLARM